MERARAKAKEIGKNLLLKAMGGSSTSGDDFDSDLRARKQTWSEVIASPPAQTSKKNVYKGAGKPQSTGTYKEEARTLLGMAPSLDGDIQGSRSPSQRLFSADEVAKLVELARKQLKRQKCSDIRLDGGGIEGRYEKGKDLRSGSG